MNKQRFLTALVKRDLVSRRRLRGLPVEEGPGAARWFRAVLREAGLSREKAMRAYAEHAGLGRVDLSEVSVQPPLLRQIDPEVARQYRVFPVDRRNNRLRLAVSEPPDSRREEDLGVLIDPPLSFWLAAPDRLDEKIQAYYGTEQGEVGSARDNREEREPGDSTPEPVHAPAPGPGSTGRRASVIRLVNRILTEALRRGASDVHFEPLRERVVVRFRLDGVLRRVRTVSREHRRSITSRIKIMAGMDITTRRLPQDGRMKLTLRGRRVDFRVSTLPGKYGESTVIRVLDRDAVQFGLSRLGFHDDHLDRLRRWIHQPHGIVLVTGPTGSGKTTTLYSAINERNTRRRKIITVEDPVEYQLDGVNQMQVNRDIGLDFLLGLKTVLRQSPDVILVGEIRDVETATTAFRAALTGHLVFSTLHTTDAPGAVGRLIDLGVKPYLIGSTLRGILSQRLVRVICERCRRPRSPETMKLRGMGDRFVELGEGRCWEGEGCDECRRTGYTGRTLIAELMSMGPRLKQMVLEKRSSRELRRAAGSKNMRSIREDGFRKVKRGVTTLSEVARVTQDVNRRGSR